MMKWSHLVQLPVPTKPFQGPCSAPLKAFDLQIRHWESLAQFRKRNWPLTFSLTSYVSHERNHTQKACFAKILRGPYWYKQSWWGANSPTSSFCILATRHVSWQTGVDCWIRNLAMLFYTNLSFKKYVNKACSFCCYHFRGIAIKIQF